MSGRNLTNPSPAQALSRKPKQVICTYVLQWVGAVKCLKFMDHGGEAILGFLACEYVLMKDQFGEEAAVMQADALDLIHMG